MSMSNWQDELGQPRRGNYIIGEKGTYNVLIFLCIMCYLWDCYGPTDILFILSRACDMSGCAPIAREKRHHLRTPIVTLRRRV